MYYKIVNTESPIFQDLHKMREEELEMEKQNDLAISEKVGLSYQNYYGFKGQQNFYRVSQYSGFQFKEPEKVNPKIWTPHKKYSSIYVPNKRTKEGKEMADFLHYSLKGSYYAKPLEIMNIEIKANRFKFPYIEIINGFIYMFLDEIHEPSDENIIEITKKEFYEALEAKTPKTLENA